MSGQDAPYLKIKTAADLALSGLRLFLQEREVLFPCQRKLLSAVRAQPGGAPLAGAAEAFLRRLDDESERAFYAAVWQSVTWTPPEDYNKLLARDVEDNELWWYRDRPNLIEW